MAWSANSPTSNRARVSDIPVAPYWRLRSAPCKAATRWSGTTARNSKRPFRPFASPCPACCIEMARWAIGDLQGCCDELEELLSRIHFSPDRDRIWFVGDLVNRGPQSLKTLRLVRALGDNALCVLGNHDLHLLALALDGAKLRKSDTLSEVLTAPDREALIEWLLHRPLAHYEPHFGDLLVHAGVVPQWSAVLTMALAQEVQLALRRDARGLLAAMYGDEPDHWQPKLSGLDRLRFTLNVLTRMRFLHADGRLDLKRKGKPECAHKHLVPWF